ncbi:serine/threonine-protein kinase [Micromonospora robiginosa]|uniref:non-specific serine/threonine protein kinase n=1 Tax=Micromonospora robiginosa TaxID=2749844 RepID=A0A7L6B5A5_9ACTN|nr:serine/threonine-protein kinase [Micromonospora ferruginea]QLQ37127.1 protein kinase [Micromonospora ferruginea]
MLTSNVVLSDRYRLTERIATGGMGAVWKCTDMLLGRDVAVKVLLPSLVADPEFTTRFQAEARMLAALRHPGIVQVHDVGAATLADGSRVSYLVMEYVDGRPLTGWVRHAGRLDPASTMSVVGQAAQALHAAHLAGIVHRDVKPANLLVKRDGTVVLVDFGIARATTMAGITAAHMVLGTASYMSPEQAAGQPVSPVTDVYALGAVAYFCLAGRPPFDGDSPLQVAMRHVQDEPPPLPPDTPPAVVEVVRRALAKSPRDRFPTAAALADGAQDARDATLASVPVPPRPPWAVGGPAVPGPPTPAPAMSGPAMPAPVDLPAGGTDPVAPGARQTSGPDVGPVAGVPPWAADSTFGAPDRPASGVDGTPPTREEPTRRGRRTGVLAGAAGVVLVAVLTAVAVAALRSPDEPGPAPTAVAGESAVAGPVATVRPSGAGPATPGASRSARPSRSSATPSRPAPQPTGSAGGGPGTGTPAPTGTPTTAPKPQPYTAAQVCGGGYQVIDSATLTAGGVRQGRVYLLYSTAAGANCVVTLKDADVGRVTTVTTYLEVKGRARQTQSGGYRYYAGPVRATAAAVCVRWGGATGGATYTSPFEHCD